MKNISINKLCTVIILIYIFFVQKKESISLKNNKCEIKYFRLTNICTNIIINTSIYKYSYYLKSGKTF